MSNLLEICLEGVHEDWIPILKNPVLEKNLELLKDTDCVPSLNLIFEWARLTPLRRVRVIILAQDPYPNDNACGLAFSCKKAPSVVNIFKALQKSGLVQAIPTEFHLRRWAKQGILLLNRSLTTARGKSGAHRDLWMDYTQKIISSIEKMINREIIFLLWGNDAKQVKCTGRRLEYFHPSPRVTIGKFEDCDHFQKVSEIYPDIDWNIEKETPRPSENLVEIMYTDGSCYPNNSSPKAEAGFAVVLENAKKVLVGKLTREFPPTNIRAEGFAILNALLYYHKNIKNGKIELHTDSQFWIDMITLYIPSWSDEYILTKKNSDLVKRIKKGWGKVGAPNFELKHVYSHGKKGAGKTKHGEFNEIADKAANFARETLKEGEIHLLDISQFTN